MIDKENGKPHIVKRMDRPGVRVIPEWFGSGTLSRKELSVFILIFTPYGMWRDQLRRVALGHGEAPGR